MKQRTAYLAWALWYCVVPSVTGCDGDESSSNSSPACPGFSRIVSGGFSRNGNHLTWTFELESMPTELVLNRAAVPDGMVDYGWQINVDVASDGQYDHNLSIMHSKVSGAAESRTTDILGSTDHYVWKSSGGTTATAIGTFDAGITGNAFTFELDDTTFTDFATVASTDQCLWTLGYRYGGISDVCADRWP